MPPFILLEESSGLLMIRDEFDGWFVIHHELLKAAFAKLPPSARKFKTIREKLQINPQQMRDFLDGKRSPSLLNFKKLCLYIQISADTLLGLSDDTE